MVNPRDQAGNAKEEKLLFNRVWAVFLSGLFLARLHIIMAKRLPRVSVNVGGEEGRMVGPGFKS